MAVVYRCDKCGREAANETALGMTRVEIPSTGTNMRKVVDLCAPCRNRLIDWLGPDPQVQVG